MLKSIRIAASAALHVTKGKSDKSDKPSNYPLDADGKLSSASALLLLIPRNVFLI